MCAAAILTVHHRSVCRVDLGDLRWPLVERSADDGLRA